MLKKALVLLAIIGLFTTAMAPDSEAARRRRLKRFQSEITAEFNNPEPEAFLGLIPMGDDETDSFEGQVLSSEAGCFANRVVAIYKTGQKNSLTHTRTDHEGRWLVGREDPAEGNYYAIAQEKRHRVKGRRILCLAARSEYMVV